MIIGSNVWHSYVDDARLQASNSVGRIANGAGSIWSSRDVSDNAAGIGSQQQGGTFGVDAGLLGAGVSFSPQQQHFGLTASSVALTVGSQQHQPIGNPISRQHTWLKR